MFEDLFYIPRSLLLRSLIESPLKTHESAKPDLLLPSLQKTEPSHAGGSSYSLKSLQFGSYAGAGGEAYWLDKNLMQRENGWASLRNGSYRVNPANDLAEVQGVAFHPFSSLSGGLSKRWDLVQPFVAGTLTLLPSAGESSISWLLKGGVALRARFLRAGVALKGIGDGSFGTAPIRQVKAELESSACVVLKKGALFCASHAFLLAPNSPFNQTFSSLGLHSDSTQAALYVPLSQDYQLSLALSDQTFKRSLEAALSSRLWSVLFYYEKESPPGSQDRELWGALFRFNFDSRVPFRSYSQLRTTELRSPVQNLNLRKASMLLADELYRQSCAIHEKGGDTYTVECNEKYLKNKQPLADIFDSKLEDFDKTIREKLPLPAGIDQRFIVQLARNIVLSTDLDDLASRYQQASAEQLVFITGALSSLLFFLNDKKAPAFYFSSQNPYRANLDSNSVFQQFKSSYFNGKKTTIPGFNCSPTRNFEYDFLVKAVGLSRAADLEIYQVGIPNRTGPHLVTLVSSRKTGKSYLVNYNQLAQGTDLESLVREYAAQQGVLLMGVHIFKDGKFLGYLENPAKKMIDLALVPDPINLPQLLAQ